ncbi:MAG: SCO family protein [Thermohalobaculum sp.]|nr:SCO family protein [Thermohalobaculum sp.]
MTVTDTAGDASVHQGHGAVPATQPDHGAHQGHGTSAGAQDGAAGHTGPADIVIDHTGHAVLPAQGSGSYVRREVVYSVPSASLRDQAARPVTLAAALDHDGPLLLNFIFTSCSTICPVMSATFGEVQPDLAALGADYRMVSITIDPEYDTPSRLRDYAGLHDAQPQWIFLTGDTAEIRKVIAAFDAIYQADNKMYHLPYTYLRAAPGQPWVRFEGLLSGAELVEEYRSVLASQPAKLN